MTEHTDEEWEEWNMEVTFTFTYVTEGPFPKEMPPEERAERVKNQFERNWSEEFYHAYTSAERHQLETAEPEPYE
jgi:hypothetical protein